MSKFDQKKRLTTEFLQRDKDGKVRARGTLTGVDPGGLGRVQGYTVRGTNVAAGKPFGPWTYKTREEAVAQIQYFLPGVEFLKGDTEGETQKQRDQDDQTIKEMVAGNQPVPRSLRARALALGFDLDADGLVRAKSASTVRQHATPEEIVLIGGWGNEFHPELARTEAQAKHNAVQLWRWCAARGRAITFAQLDEALSALRRLGCIQEEPVPAGRKRETPFGQPWTPGARATEYDWERDPELRRRTFSDAELAVARSRLVQAGFPQGSTITVEQAAKVLGDAALAQALLEAASVR
jgi:hypothetical protein